MRKKGLLVVFEGTDGSGKTTIIDALPSQINYRKDEIVYYHWRPGFIKSPNKNSNENTGEICTDPHGKQPYGKLVSLGKFLYFNLDYIFGYQFKIKKDLREDKLVVFDRYYYDYYLDKMRYRLDISDTWLNFCLRMIPKPDYTFLLVGDAETLYNRKKEISIEEIQEQVNKLLAMKQKFTNSIVIDVNQNIEDVVKQVAHYINVK